MMVHRSACDTCDEKIDWVSRTAEFGNNCPFCQFGTLEPVGMAGCVMGIGSDIRPELHELVQELRDVDRDEYREPAYKERMAIADRLERLIKDSTRQTAQEGVSE